MRRVVLLVLSIVGVAFLIPTVVMLGIFRHQTADMVPVEGAIAAWEGDTPVVSYEVDGEAYTARMSVSSTMHWAVGSPYRMFADPENPERVADYFLALLGGIFGVTALILLGTGWIIWFVMGRRESAREELFQYGLRASAVITELRENRSVTVNNRHPWVAVATCVHPTTREQVTLRSHMVWKPSVQVGDTVEAAFDPMDERRYALNIPEASA